MAERNSPCYSATLWENSEALSSHFGLYDGLEMSTTSHSTTGFSALTANLTMPLYLLLPCSGNSRDSTGAMARFCSKHHQYRTVVSQCYGNAVLYGPPPTGTRRTMGQPCVKSPILPSPQQAVAHTANTHAPLGGVVWCRHDVPETHSVDGSAANASTFQRVQRSTRHSM
jgi:hypothetical protein